MDAACKKALGLIEGMSLPIQNQEQIAMVGTISANGDARLGNLLAEAIAKVGKDGVVTVEESKGTTLEIETTDGMFLDKGLASSAFVDFGGHDGVNVSLENPLVFVTDHEITDVRPLIKVIEGIVEEGRSVVWFSPNFGEHAIATFVGNLRQKTLTSVAIKAPAFGDRQTAILQDIATLTGATFVSKGASMTFGEVTREMFGQAEVIRSSVKDCLIIGGAGTQEAIDARVAQIRGEIQRSGSEFDREKLQERMSKLLGGICTIKVGSPSELELKELKARLEDALYATKASLDGGIVAGGGTTLLRAGALIGPPPENFSDSEKSGWNLVATACQAPFRQILRNAGASPSIWVLAAGAHQGVNVALSDLALCHMLDAGIIDPTKVVTSALANAVSVAGTILTVECIVRKPSKEEAAALAE
jgi:chaperonin GroEL